jgi:4-amino-4-deoxy-L-arabinose transferase-like glycosyltransferase
MNGHEMRNEKWSITWEHVLPTAVCLVYLAIAVYAGRDFVVGGWGDSDIYLLYAPDAKHIANGEFPENTVANGPGFPLVLSAVTALTGDHFTAGKWISAFSASLAGLVAYYLLRALFGFRTAILALPLILVAGEYALFSIRPYTDLMFLLVCLTTIFTIACTKLGVWQKTILAGMLAGLAYLTRYNGIFLPATTVTGIVIFNCFGLPLLKRLQVTAVHIVSFLVIISPWLWLNYVHHGSPLYSTNYLNMAVEFYRYKYGYKIDADGFAQAAMVFKSFGDVVFHDPKGFVLHYLHNIARRITTSLSGEFILRPIGLMAVAAIPVVLIKLRQREIWVFLFSLLLYILLMSFTFWDNRYYFYVMVCYIGLASYLVTTTADWISDNGWLSRRMTHVGVLCVGITVFCLSAMTSIKTIKQHIENQPYELIRASEYLKSVSANGARIVAKKPILAFMVNGKGVHFPQVKSIDELHESLNNVPAEYLAYDRFALAYHPELKMLAEPVKTIPWLKPVYSDLQRSLVIYRIEMDNAGQAGSLPTAQ